jgi:hypothetical protein
VGLSGKILLKLQRLNFQDVEIIPFDHCTHWGGNDFPIPFVDLYHKYIFLKLVYR